VHGRARGRRIKKKSSKPGTAFIHHALDDHSRLTYSEILDDERNETVCAFWQRANAYFASCGITVKRVLTDNGSAYRSRQFADTLGPITHKRTRPYRPRTNGNVERFNRTQEQEWAYAHPYRTESEGVAAFPAFLHTYNHHRGHHAPRRRQPTAYPTPPGSTPRSPGPATSNACSGPTTSGRSRRSGTRKCRLVRVFGAVSAQHPSQARAARRPLHIPARLCCHQFLVSLEERLPSGTVATGLDIGLALEPGEEVGVAFAQERPRPWVTDPREVASIRRQAAVVSPTRRGGPLVDGRIPSPTGRQPSGSASGSLKSRGACCPS
jgi:hypothetical protein